MASVLSGLPAVTFNATEFALFPGYFDPPSNCTLNATEAREEMTHIAQFKDGLAGIETAILCDEVSLFKRHWCNGLCRNTKTMFFTIFHASFSSSSKKTKR